MRQEKNITLIKQFIREVIPYKKEIVFFGSRANGGGTKNSDYDILVIVHPKRIDRKELIRFQAKIKRLCARAFIDADILVRDYAHVAEMKLLSENIIHSALLSGVRIQ